MKIQNLAVIFIIIILPISLILTSFVQSQVKTLSLQIDYDTRLNNSTYDALKAFQLNTINSDSSDIANSKLRDINASVNSFFNSIATNFNISGYNKDILKEYVPALVYTMYDGYYIYSPFDNNLDDINKNNEVNGLYNIEYKTDAEILNQNNQEATYKQGDRVYGLKPYIYYSCRYKRGDDDFVISYSLDNYITIQGTIDGKTIFDYGYLLNNISLDGTKYRDVDIISGEELEEYIVDSEISKPTKYKYVKINGVKYYQDNNAPHKWFSLLNGERHYTEEKFNVETKAGIEYYKKAREFTDRVLNSSYKSLDGNTKSGYNLKELKGSNAVEIDEDGNYKSITELGNYNIFFNDNSHSIEDPDSNFNQQRMSVIKYSIEKNLSIAIANYNRYSKTDNVNFQMPKLKEDEWDKIMDNISIISFLQGMNIGGKVYNGYSVITNTKNKELVSEDSIYITTSDGEYHRPNENGLEANVNVEQGFFNIDFEIKSNKNNNGDIIYYNSKQFFNSDIGKYDAYSGSYNSIINQAGLNITDNIYKYMEDMAKLDERI